MKPNVNDLSSMLFQGTLERGRIREKSAIFSNFIFLFAGTPTASSTASPRPRPSDKDQDAASEAVQQAARAHDRVRVLRSDLPRGTQEETPR